MQAIIKGHGSTRYLHITRSSGTTFADFKRSRAKMRLQFQSGSQRVLSDCRAVDLERISLIDADTLARDLKDDLPACRRVAVISRSLTAPVFRHFQNVCRCYGIEARFFTDPAAGSAWLCSEEEAWGDEAESPEAEEAGGRAPRSHRPLGG